MKFKRIILYLITFFFFPISVFANNFGLSVDKTAVVLDADAGEIRQFSIKVKNISNETQEVVIDAMDYILNDNNEIILSQDINNQNGIKTWVNVQNNNIILNPGDSTDVFFELNIFENATVGSHRGAIIFKVIPNSEDTVQVQGQIGVHILINVEGDVHSGGHINFFDVPFLSLGLTRYETEFENTGNIHYVPYGEVVLTNIFTKKKESYKYDKHFVFPQKKVKFVLFRQIPSLFGLYKVQVIFIDGEGVSRNKIDYVMGYFFPVIFIGSMFGIIYLLWFFYKKTDRNRRQKKVKKTKNINDKSKKNIKNDVNSNRHKTLITNEDEFNCKINVKTDKE